MLEDEFRKELPLFGLDNAKTVVLMGIPTYKRLQRENRNIILDMIITKSHRELRVLMVRRDI